MITIIYLWKQPRTGVFLERIKIFKRQRISSYHCAKNYCEHDPKLKLIAELMLMWYFTDAQSFGANKEGTEYL